MKNIFVIITLLLISAISFGQAPEKMSYQAMVRDSGDNLVANQVLGMQISILQTSTSGTAVYIETQNPTTNVNGLVSLEIGAGSIVSGDFTTIDWSAGPYYIKTDYDLTGGTSYTISGVGQFLSVPNAEHAKNGISTDGTDGQILRVNSSGEAEWVTALFVSTFYADTDGDGFGDINSTYVAVSAPNGYVSDNTDCDDSDITINPNTVWSFDPDNDGYAAPTSSTVTQCNSPGVGYKPTLLPLGDCNDGDATINPGVLEIVGDGIDNNCDGTIDEVYIGQSVYGGFVAYIFESGDIGYISGEVHGIVVAPSDISVIPWQSDYNYSFIALDSGIGYGESNTNAIFAAHPSSAAADCYNYTSGGYSDWFLPSIDELHQIWVNLDPNINSNVASFAFGNYWSSTGSTTDEDRAWQLWFLYGSRDQGYKNDIYYNYRVRPARYF